MRYVNETVEKITDFYNRVPSGLFYTPFGSEFQRATLTLCFFQQEAYAPKGALLLANEFCNKSVFSNYDEDDYYYEDEEEEDDEDLEDEGFETFEEDDED